MSFNQSKSEKSDTVYQKSGRSASFNQQRGSSGTYGKGGGGGGGPTPSVTWASSLSSRRSFNKKSNNAQGGQSRVNPTPGNSTESNSDSASRTAQNGTHVHPQLQGASDAQGTTKSSDSSAAQRSTRIVPKAPTSQPPTMSSDPFAPTTPAKGDATMAFPFQFGSISPGLMNGMAIPARTSSAPPNLDEQKCDQARHDLYRSVPSVSTPPVPKQQQPPRKDASVIGQSNVGETHIGTKVKKDPKVSASILVSQMQNPSVVPLTGISIQMPYHQSQASLPFGGPNPQIQSQGMATTSLQMAIPVGNAAQVQQQVFVPGLQPHPMHPQGMIQGQNMTFTPQMGHQLSHQLGNMSIGIGPQYPQQHGGKFAGPRKTTTVKITHPETHEELRLDKRTDAYPDGSSGVRSHPNMPSQSQPVQSFAASHPMNYYPPSSYNTSSLYYAPNSLPLKTTNSQPPRFSYPVNHGPQNMGVMNSLSLSSTPPVDKTSTPSHGNVEQPLPEYSHGMPNSKSAVPSEASVTIKPRGASVVADSSFSNSSFSCVQNRDSTSSAASCDANSSVSQKGSKTSPEISSLQSKMSSNSLVQPKKSAASADKLADAPLVQPSSAMNEDYVLVVPNNEGRKMESLSRSNSLKDNQRKPGKKGQSHQQVSVPTMANMLPQGVDSGVSDSGVSEPVGTKTNHSAAISAEDAPTSSVTITTTNSSIPSAVEVNNNINSSVEVSSFVSAEGLAVQASDSLNNDKDEKLGESLEDSRQIKQDAGKVSTEVLPLETALQEQDESASCITDCDRTDLQMSGPPETTSDHVKHCLANAGSDPAGSDPMSLLAPGTNDRPVFESNKVKTSKGKKQKRKILQKADAAGSTSDLYNAYKGPEEKKESALSSESTESASTSESLKQFPTDAAQPDAVASEKCGQSRAEPDDWEDAADMSTTKLEVDDRSQQVSDDSGGAAKKYSRDFLLKFAEQCTDLPKGFKITDDIVEPVMSSNISSSYVMERDSHPSPGRIVDRPGGMSRMDRRGNGIIEDDRRNKVCSAFYSGRSLDGIGSNAGFRSNQGSNCGVLRNPRAQYAGGILSGPMQSMGNQGGMQRNNADGERWQRSASFPQRGLIPSPTPQTPLQMMHKAEKKYEVGKAQDEEEVKQRQLKAILNKLTPQNFERLFEQVKAVNIDNAVTLTGVISQIFEKALMEPTFCEMYANFCLHLASELPDFSEDDEKITFKRLLLNKCEEEFGRGEREQEEANKADEGDVKQSNEEREERRVKARRRMLGNIRLIGELYKKRMLTERIMHECIKKLLGGQYQDPDEEDLEALCKLMSTIGEMIDHPKAKGHMDAYFERMKSLSSNMNLSSRVRFMLKDAIDLRKNKWQQRRKVEGPKKIEEVHRDAAQERQAQSGRLGRGPGNNPLARRNPMDFSPRGSSMLSSPTAQIGGLRRMPGQVRGFGSQDARFEERQSYEARALSVPLPQRPLGDDSITLGPQGGLARRMSIRGSTAISSSSISDVHPAPAESHRGTSGLNGYGNFPERAPYNAREDLASRYTTDRFSGPAAYDQSSAPDRNISFGNRDLRNLDRNLDRPVATSPSAQLQGSIISQITSEKILLEEQLRDMSMAAIREYYSARDEKEVALRVKELNSPSFHPSMVSLWVRDSFERKDTERDLLAKLLVNLVKSQDDILTRSELIKGFESVLSTVEDAVNDAPRAAEFLGRIFAKAITEYVVTLDEIGRLIHDGGEEPGSLLLVGLAADILGGTLEVITLEKGDAALGDIRASSNLQLETFRPPNPIISRQLEKFI